jgi:hypothetical protein
MASRHCAAARLRSGSPTRLRSAAQRRNHPHPVQVVIPNTLTNPFQDLTKGLRERGPLQNSG